MKKNPNDIYARIIQKACIAAAESLEKDLVKHKLDFCCGRESMLHVADFIYHVESDVKKKSSRGRKASR